jgi:hypothetical protein
METNTKRVIMETKHTMGPWLTTRSCDDIHYANINAPQWGALASVVVRNEMKARDCEEGWANAKLIAAAPELLEALQLFIGTPQSPELIFQNKEMYIKAKAAIEKATK